MKKNLYKEKNTTYTKRIADVIEFERITVIRTKYTNEHPTNNLIAINYSGDIVWEIDTVAKPLEAQTVVSIGKIDDRHVRAITFTGLNLLIDVETGKVVEKSVTK